MDKATQDLLARYDDTTAAMLLKVIEIRDEYDRALMEILRKDGLEGRALRSAFFHDAHRQYIIRQIMDIMNSAAGIREVILGNETERG